MTLQELKDLIKRLNPHLKEYWDSGVTVPRALYDTAAYCFINNVNDQNDTKELKEQILHLEKYGFLKVK